MKIGFTCSLILIVLVMPAASQTYSYEDTMAIVGDTVRPGDTVNVIVKMVNTFNVGGFCFRIKYDSTSLHLNNVSLMPRAAMLAVNGANMAHPGVVRFFAVAINPLIDHMDPGSGPVATLHFSVCWNTFSGPINLTFEDSLLADNSMSDDLGLHVYIPVLTDSIVTIIDGSGIDDDNLPEDYYFDVYNFPNPFNLSTKITFSSITPGEGAIRIYDMLGRLVRCFTVETPPGRSSYIIWDGLDESGRDVGSGVYYYTLFLNEIPMISRKMIILR